MLNGKIKVGESYACNDGTISTVIGVDDGVVTFREGNDAKFYLSDEGFRRHHVALDAQETPEAKVARLRAELAEAEAEAEALAEALACAFPNKLTLRCATSEDDTIIARTISHNEIDVVITESSRFCAVTMRREAARQLGTWLLAYAESDSNSDADSY